MRFFYIVSLPQLHACKFVSDKANFLTLDLAPLGPFHKAIFTKFIQHPYSFVLQM
jgi:hypothetical protein